MAPAQFPEGNAQADMSEPKQELVSVSPGAEELGYDHPAQPQNSLLYPELPLTSVDPLEFADLMASLGRKRRMISSREGMQLLLPSCFLCSLPCPAMAFPVAQPPGTALGRRISWQGDVFGGREMSAKP